MNTIHRYASSIANKLNALAATREVGPAPDVFNDFIQSVFNMIADPQMMDSLKIGRGISVKDGWRTPLRHYKGHPQSREMLGAAVAEYGKAIIVCPPFSDILGEICTEFGDPALGQFLSPSDVADLLTSVQWAAQLRGDESAPRSVSDETGCGAGGLILAWLRRTYERKGVCGIACLDVFVNDMDPWMMKACCVQIAMPLLVKQMKLRSFRASCCNVLLHPHPSQTAFVYEHESFKGRPDIGGFVDRLRMAAALAEST